MRGLLLVLLLCLAFSAAGQNRSYNVYIDTDNDSTTGCTVLQPDFLTQFDGIDGYISVNTSTPPVVITSSFYHECVSGSFSAGSPVVMSALGFNTGVSGDDVFEFQMNSSDMGIINTTSIRLYYSAESDLSTDIVSQNDLGGEILTGVAFPIPALSAISLMILIVMLFLYTKRVYKNKALLLTSVLLFSSVVWGMFLFVIDGNVDDWSQFTPISDPIGDNSAPDNSSDISRVFANLEQDLFTARMDVVDVENVPPAIISSPTVSVVENQTSVIDVESTDANGDTEGAGLSYTLTGVIDDSLFNIDVNTGVITFLSAPDYEVPADTGADNNYDIQVTVTDSGALTDVQNIVVTVTNDVNDDSSVAFLVNSSSTVDESTALSVAVKLTALAPLSAPLSVDVVDAGSGTAVSTGDYSAFGTQTVTFPMGATDGTILNVTLSPVTDLLIEGPETVDLLMQNISGPGFLGSQLNHEVTITDENVATVAFEFGISSTVDESTPLAVAVRLDVVGASQLEYPVSMDVVDAGGGSALSGTDYTVFGTQTVTFPANAANGALQVVTLSPIDDPDIEGDETVNLALQNLSGNSSVTFTAPVFHTVTITDDDNQAPVANNDALTAMVNIINNYGATTLFVDNGSGVDDLGQPGATLVSFGGGSVGGVVTDNPAGGTVAFAGGTLSVNADGSLSVSNPTASGDFTFDYRIQNVAGFSDATVTVTIQFPPAAQDDSYAFVTNTDQNVAAGAGLFVDNGNGADILGFPAATLVSFGGGSLGGAVTDNVSGASVGFAGGSLTVNSDGSWTLTGQPFNPGTYSFLYRVQNAVGFSDATVTLNISIPNSPPVANNDSYGSIGNVGISVPVASGLISNDTDPDLDPLTVTSGTFTTTQGGSVTIATDGSFDYTPATGFNGDDTFSYTLHDTNMTTDTATATITVVNKIWFINDTVAASGDGSLNSAFKNTSDFESAGSDGTGDCIYVYYASGANYSSVITLLNGQKLIGEGSASGLAAECGIAVPSFSKSLPVTNGTDKPVLIGATGINVASNNTIRGFNVVNAEPKVSGSNFGTLKIRDMIMSNNGGALNLSNGIADIVIDSINAINSSAFGIRLVNVSGAFTVTGATFIQSPAESGILIENSNLIYTFADVGVFSRQKAGITINAFTGGLQTGTFGNVTIINSGSANNTTGLAIDNIITAGSTINILSVEINNQNSNSSGIALSNNDGATININGGTVSGSNSAAVSISSGSGSVNMAASVSGSTGRTLQILNNNGGSVTLSGAISGAGPGSQGINISNNTGTTINLSGTLSLTTFTNDAFTATGGGILNVTGSGNSIDTSTGVAVKITDTSIGASGVQFQSVHSNGAVNGIVLNNTGNTGPFEISGTGASTNPGVRGTLGSFTGGGVENSSGDAIVMNNASNITLKSMNIFNNTGNGISATGVNNLNLENIIINGTGIHGIDGSSVNGFSMKNSKFSNNGNSAGENALSFGKAGLLPNPPVQGLTGIATILDSQIESYANTGMSFRNISGNLNMTIMNTACGASQGVNAQEGLLLLPGQTAVMTVLIDNSDFAQVNTFAINAFVGLQAIDTSKLNLTISNSRLNNPALPGSLVKFETISDNTSSLSVLGSNLTSSGNTDGINILRSNTAVVHATIQNNTITGDNNLTQNGVRFIHEDPSDGNSYVLVDNNTVTGFISNGILIDARNTSGAGQMHATLTNNDITASIFSSLNGIYTRSRNNNLLISDIRLNTTSSGFINSIRLRNDSTQIAQLSGILGPTAADAVTYLDANNTLANPSTASGTFANGSPIIPIPTPLP